MDLHRDDEGGDRKEGQGIDVDAAASIGRQLDTHGAMLEQILAILQAEPEGAGAGLGELLAALVAAIGEQGRYLKEISVTLAKLARDLPLDLVAAIDDNLDIPRRNGADGGGSLPS